MVSLQIANGLNQFEILYHRDTLKQQTITNKQKKNYLDTTKLSAPRHYAN